ncbi:D-amino-acid dehydrogenase [Gillisia sp. Hel_I_86]|uniref:NAD(P)/FAD-dependent oxidoreductase n=1 Tax=Gillisia sp. Hel_I_86 TaxID=1249981 RepID=UPI00119B61A4|nr:FAD-dependent oxidoreductase [Gillisia sp. Hel_I_86]TVZ26020.1 D-amino-acid dehydrogenase [Gillisia sp. Hel_I_86]
MKKVVIIGGGIIGLFSAYYLVKNGCEVTVVDKGDLTTGASFINAGYLTPSHFISLASPGMINKGLKWMFNSASPFYIQPRLDIDFFKWAWAFKKSASVSNVEKAVPIIKEINLKSRDLYEEILTSGDFKFHYEKQGLLMAFVSQRGKEEELKMAERAVKEGLEAEIISGETLKKIQPVFSDKVMGAVHYKCDRHTTPNHFMNSLKDWLEDNGVHFELRQDVKDIVIENQNIVAIETEQNSFRADEFVLAAGSWTFDLAKKLGLNIPIQGGKGYSIDVNRTTGISMPAILVEAKVAVTPMDGFTRFAGTMEFSGNNSIIRKNRIETISKAVSSFYRNIEISSKEKKDSKCGLRPVSPDGLPFIGRTYKYTNLTVAAGHAMMGWSLGPITGKLVSEIIVGQKTSVNLQPFRIERF